MQEMVMKCEVCLEKLEEYLDGELSADESSQVEAHLITCSACSAESVSLVADQELFARYDREIEVPKTLWGQIVERTAPVSNAPTSFSERLAGLFRVPSFGFSLAAAAALIIIAIAVGATYLSSHKPEQKMTAKDNVVLPKVNQEQPEFVKEPKSEVVVSNPRRRSKRAVKVASSPIDQSDVLSTDFGYQDIDDRDTAKHLEQTQNLLRSIRNVSLSDNNDQDIDVTYDKALSRRLLNENIVLRRDAEMKAKFPAKSLLSDLEPFLIDIANLPDHARPNEVRIIKERVQKTEIVAALIGYE
jgi:anti-sigma factor RsiW